MIRSVAFGILVLAQAASSYPPAFPRRNVTLLMESDRVAVWDIVWPKGEPTPLHRHVYDQVGTYYQPGGRVITTPDGTKRHTTTAVGQLSNTGRGTLHVEEGTTDPPLRAVFIELKRDEPSGGVAVGEDLPAPFPRDGATRLADTSRVAVWDYTWRAGTPKRTHRHRRDVVVVWLGEGTLRVATGTAPTAVVRVRPGTMRYTPRDTIESEELIDGSPRAYAFELK